jgi:hypothetical protein
MIWYVYKDVPQVVRDDTGPLKPQQPTILNITGGLMDKYTYNIGLPELGAHDVVSRELHISVNGEMSMIVIEDIHMTHHELILEENADCHIWVVDIDDAGNRSADGEKLSFIVIDIVPPSSPAAPVIADVVLYEEPVVEEVVEEEVVVEEPVVEEIVEEPIVEEIVEEEIVEPVVEEVVAEEVAEEIVEPVVEEIVEEVVEEVVAEEVVAEEVVEPVVEETPEVIDGEPTA